MYKSLGELLQSQVLKISKRRKLKLQLFQNWAILAGTKAIKMTKLTLPLIDLLHF